MMWCFPFLSNKVEKQVSIFAIHKVTVIQFVLKITLNIQIRSRFKIIFFYLLCNLREDVT